jgi:hypothetical protein
VPQGGGDRDQRRRQREPPRAVSPQRLHSLQRRDQRLHRGKPVVRVTLQAALEEPHQRPRQVAPTRRPQPRPDAVRDHLHRVAQERPAPVQRLVQGHAEAELIGATGGGAAAKQLGCHVGRRAAQAARSRGAGGCRFTARRHHRQAEVGDDGATVHADQHVLRLEVAVDDPAEMRSVQAGTGLGEAGTHLAPGAPPAAQPLAQGLAADELHDQEGLAVLHPGLVQGDDVAVRQPGDRLRLAQPGPVWRVRMQELDRHLSPQPGILRGIHHAGGTGTQHRVQEEAPETETASSGPRRHRRPGFVAAAGQLAHQAPAIAAAGQMMFQPAGPPHRPGSVRESGNLAVARTGGAGRRASWCSGRRGHRLPAVLRPRLPQQ